jgi:hypothetical protein
MAMTARELRWQQDAGNNTAVSNAFRDMVLAVDNKLVMFAYMVDGCPFVNSLHSVKTYFDIESGDDVNHKTIAFVGDRTSHRDPYPVILTARLPWDWKECEVSMDPALAEAWCTNPANEKKCWNIPTTTMKKWFPRMLLLPTVLVTFVLAKK